MAGREVDMSVPVRDVILRDGSTLRLRGAEPRDQDRVLEFFQRLSPESMHLRFGDMRDPSLAAAESYAGGDSIERLVLLGTRNGRVVALGSFDRLRDATAAEVAFTVEDPLQGHGVGTRLLEQLAALAARSGVERFIAQVDLANRQMLGVFRDAGFEVTRHVSGGVAEMSFPIRPTEAYLERVDERDRDAAVVSLARFFRPASVAVVGASDRAGSIGNSVVRNLLGADFRGAVYPVNLRGAPVAGVPAARSVSELPVPADMAVVCVPAESVVEAVEQVLERGTRAVCVISAGFAETGADGLSRQQQLLELIRRHGARLLGPNCLGIAVPGSHLNATFAPRPFPPGSIGFSSQSGALGLALLEKTATRGVGLSAFVSIGNKADISSNDLLSYWETDEDTALVLLYVESFGNPRTFARVARRVARRKPVIAIKSGSSRAGARAAGSHTAALAGSEAAVEALFREAGVVRAVTLGEALDAASLLSTQPLPAGNRAGIITNAGGLGILCADACEAAGIELPPPAPETVARLAALLPAEASTKNPVDLLGSATAAAYAKAIPLVLADPNVDALIVLFAPAAPATADEVADAVRQAAAGASKPVLAVVMTAQGVPAAFAHPGSGVAAFSYPESAARALGRAVERRRWLRRPAGVTRRPEGIDQPAARAIVDEALSAGRGWLEADELRSLMEHYGLPLVPERLADSPAAAASAAVELGMPVAVKLAEAGAHKTERGGVRLGLADTAAVEEAARAMDGRVLVQPMARPGVELLAGLVQDPVFGPLVAFGPGGVMAELIGEAGFRIAPISDVDVAELLSTGKTGRLVTGFRGAPAADAAALADLLMRLSALAEDIPEVAELDMNPVIAHPAGCTIVDCRARVAPRAEVQAAKTW
ncbi:MAG TPA: GNAT family N-acetyltransferase [Gaiellales bacterium]|jgi:acetyl coenzyme A synthetase (ADP forming)-like protein